MAIKRPKPEEIVMKLRQVEVLMRQGMPRVDAIRQISVTEQTYYRWKKKYGGMGIEQLKGCCQTNENSHRIAGAALIYALNGAVRRMRTHIRLLAQPESMRSTVGATR